MEGSRNGDLTAAMGLLLGYSWISGGILIYLAELCQHITRSLSSATGMIVAELFRQISSSKSWDFSSKHFPAAKA